MTIEQVNRLRQAGFSDEKIREFARMQAQGVMPVAPPPSPSPDPSPSPQGVGGWLTNGNQLFEGAAVSALGNILNLPSYALGGILDTIQKGTVHPLRGAVQGIRNKQAVMDELPDTLGLDPNSLAGMAVGFAGELATPGLPVGKALRFVDKGVNATERARDVVNLLGRGLEDAGTAYLTAGLGSPKTLSQAIALSPDGIAKLFDDYNLYSRDPEAVKAAREMAAKAYDAVIQNSRKTIGLEDIRPLFTEQMNELEELRRAGSKTAESIQQDLRQRYKAAARQTKRGSQKLPLSYIRTLRQAADLDTPQGAFSLNTSLEKGAKQTRDLYMNIINNAEPRAKKLGRDYAALKNLQTVVDSAANRATARKPFSLTSLGTSGVGAVLGGLPGAIAGYAAEQVISSPKGIEVISKTLRKTGKAIQKAKLPALRFGKTGRRAAKIFSTVGRVSLQE